ncbi:hypothetical protein K443DRAFT_91386 [Laccaria amethystina LaAM-08-1]|uniref:Uncharacterized protein n=1 Tax=Laccaria amethystina LaAM-08-1 TaxID=1095629 RepID=A0A0C9XJZ3_9AGAR|nr:hypothetical protein K443DRAFT_91386 [Laccaria amethystina LaAM-08-1]
MGRRDARVRNTSYLIGSSSVLKQVHPDTCISNKVTAIHNSPVSDIFKHIALTPQTGTP